ncbi:MAG: hypothetical protein ACTHKJ_05965 [Candidatus Nitrosocosmicus sp.]
MSNNNKNNTFQSESFLSYGSFLLVGKGASLEQNIHVTLMS